MRNYYTQITEIVPEKVLLDIDIPAQEICTMAQKFIAKTKYGYVTTCLKDLKTGRKPGIISATNKTEYFINMVKDKGCKYDLSRVNYVDAKTKIKVICRNHGEFLITPSNLAHGKSCYKCGRESAATKMSKNPVGWSDSNWETSGKKSKNFKGFRLYVLQCESDNENFIKVGRTYTTLKQRYGNNHIPYGWRILKTFQSSAKKVCKLERQIKREFKDHRYIPENKFGGCYECFTYECLERIITYIETY